MIRRLWRKHPVLLSAFVLSCVVVLFFATRLVMQGLYWSDPAHRNLQVASWMTVGYVARSWHLDPRQIDELIAVTAAERGPKPLIELARGRGVPVAVVIKEVEDAIAVLIVRRALQ